MKHNIVPRRRANHPRRGQFLSPPASFMMSRRMTIAVQKAPRILCDEAQRIARQLYDLKVLASPLPSERDQNFLLQTERGERFVLKVANAEENKDFLDLQNQLVHFLSAGKVNLEFPRIISSTSGQDISSIKLLGRCSNKSSVERAGIFAPVTAAIHIRHRYFLHPGGTPAPTRSLELIWAEINQNANRQSQRNTGTPAHRISFRFQVGSPPCSICELGRR